MQPCLQDITFYILQNCFLNIVMKNKMAACFIMVKMVKKKKTAVATSRYLLVNKHFTDAFSIKILVVVNDNYQIVLFML